MAKTQALLNVPKFFRLLLFSVFVDIDGITDGSSGWEFLRCFVCSVLKSAAHPKRYPDFEFA